MYKEALAVRQKVLGPEHPDNTTSLSNLAVLLQAWGKLAQAEPMYREALAVSQKILGPEHADTARSLNNLAGLLRAQGKRSNT
jgi:Flp pilus assembly protein TadD